MFSQTVEYALRAVVHLADQAPRASTTDQIALATLVPKAYLSKVLQSLNRGGIVQSKRGLKGGISLAKKPESLTLLEVVNAVDPIVRIKECPLGLESHSKSLCPLHRRLDAAHELLEEIFGQTTLAEILNERNQPPLCQSTPLSIKRRIKS